MKRSENEIKDIRSEVALLLMFARPEDVEFIVSNLRDPESDHHQWGYPPGSPAVHEPWVARRMSPRTLIDNHLKGWYGRLSGEFDKFKNVVDSFPDKWVDPDEWLMRRV